MISYHLVAVLEAREGHLSNRVLLVGGLLSRQQRSIGSEREMDTGEANASQALLEKNNISAYGTKLVWNSLRSTLREPSKRRDAVTEETTWAISLFKLEKLGCETPRLFLQMS
jgi:hypothetical protein